jgi:hypothetical protein
MLQALSRWKTTILIVSALLAVGLFSSRHLVGRLADGSVPAGPVSPQAAGELVGEWGQVCGRVAEAVQVPDIGGKPTFLNFGRAHPSQSFTAVIWGDDRKRWKKSPESLYQGQSICVTGTVERHEGTPQIVVSSPTKIRVHRGSGENSMSH